MRPAAVKWLALQRRQKLTADDETLRQAERLRRVCFCDPRPPSIATAVPLSDNVAEASAEGVSVVDSCHRPSAPPRASKLAELCAVVGRTKGQRQSAHTVADTSSGCDSAQGEPTPHTAPFAVSPLMLSELKWEEAAVRARLTAEELDERLLVTLTRCREMEKTRFAVTRHPDASRPPKRGSLHRASQPPTRQFYQ